MYKLVFIEKLHIKYVRLLMNEELFMRRVIKKVRPHDTDSNPPLSPPDPHSTLRLEV